MPDCGCVIHPGETHEQHLDRLWHQRNLEHLAHAQDKSREPRSRWLAMAAFVREEAQRLAEKQWLMESGRWPAELPGPAPS